MGRLLAIGGGVVWLVVIALVALTAHHFTRPRIVPSLATVPTLLRELNAIDSAKGESWLVTKVTSAHHVLIVNVDADSVGDARHIADEIVVSMRSRRFDEVLVYVWQIRHHKSYADRRIQWTPKGGYAELVMGD